VRPMSAFGPKRTSPVAPHMSAFGGKADTAFCGISLSQSLLGVKRTCSVALHMSAFDPKRTSVLRRNYRLALGPTRYRLQKFTSCRMRLTRFALLRGPH